MLAFSFSNLIYIFNHKSAVHRWRLFCWRQHVSIINIKLQGIFSVIFQSPLEKSHGLFVKGIYYFNIYPANSCVSERDILLNLCCVVMWSFSISRRAHKYQDITLYGSQKSNTHTFYLGLAGNYKLDYKHFIFRSTYK